MNFVEKILGKKTLLFIELEQGMPPEAVGNIREHVKACFERDGTVQVIISSYQIRKIHIVEAFL